MARARIKVNGVVGSNTDLPIATLVQLDNDGDGTEQTYLWTIASQPIGPADGLSSSTIHNPTLTPNKEGSYRITLTVDKGLISERSDAVILGIRQLKTRIRIPAIGETTEAVNWGIDIANICQMTDALRADPGLMVAQLGAGSFSVNTVVKPAGFTTLKLGLPGQENVLVVTPTDASTSQGAYGTLFLVVGTVDGSALAAGKLAYVRKFGMVEQISTLSGAIPGDSVFLSDGGSLTLTPGTHKRQVGRVIYINNGVAKIFFDAPAIDPNGAVPPFVHDEIVFVGAPISNGTATPKRTASRVVQIARYSPVYGPLSRVVWFKATLETTAGSANVDLYNETDSETVTETALTTTSTDPTELSALLPVGSAPGDLKDNKLYSVRVWITGGGASDVATIRHARLEITYEETILE
jgi:hypothetical protein